MTETLNDRRGSAPESRDLAPIGTDAPAVDSTPVHENQQAVIAVFADFDTAHRAVERLLDAGLRPDQISVVGRDLQSELRLNGYVTTGDIAGPSAATGAWVGGLFGLLAGSALLFVPGAGPLIVLGPLAAAAVGAGQGALLGGAVGAVLGHFVAKRHLPRYEQLVRAGSYLVVVHGTDEEVDQARQALTAAGSTDVRRHDEYRGDRIGPISQVLEGMAVRDTVGRTVGTVTLVKLGDPEAVTSRGQATVDDEPHVPGELRERLLLAGFIKIDRKGLLRADAYATAEDIDRVQDSVVYLAVDDKHLLSEV
ncbi:hypothetical protein ODJ79_44380 [Actinoplanes sp. KI2]|uniref:general stress protein n=1 Tax=Actinoplanes sp. KI2 TaxID=2983315 RepID=UPI0021D5B070|nr:general stress protein [Actinoplanes sp. KI2]MCU7730795.1 hypothetical protein [Actinoplanes sp. KI2]